MKQFDTVRAEVRQRTTAPGGAPLRSGVHSLDGHTFAFLVMWQLEDDDARYPNEWSLQPADDEGKSAFDAAGIHWIASGDVVLEVANA
jgi:hypothetical protein